MVVIAPDLDEEGEVFRHHVRAYVIFVIGCVLAPVVLDLVFLWCIFLWWKTSPKLRIMIGVLPPILFVFEGI